MVEDVEGKSLICSTEMTAASDTFKYRKQRALNKKNKMKKTTLERGFEAIFKPPLGHVSLKHEKTGDKVATILSSSNI